MAFSCNSISIVYYLYSYIYYSSVKFPSDIKRGLVSVNEYLQRDGAKSTIELAGVEHSKGVQYIGIERKVKFFQLQAHIKRDFERLIPYIRRKIKYPEKPVPFVIYNEWNKETYEVYLTSCVELPDNNEVAPH